MIDFTVNSLIKIEHFSFCYHVTVERQFLLTFGWNCGVRKRGGSLWAEISGEKGGRPPTTFGIRKLPCLGYHVALFAWSFV